MEFSVLETQETPSAATSSTMRSSFTLLMASENATSLPPKWDSSSSLTKVAVDHCHSLRHSTSLGRLSAARVVTKTNNNWKSYPLLEP